MRHLGEEDLVHGRRHDDLRARQQRVLRRLPPVRALAGPRNRTREALERESARQRAAHQAPGRQQPERQAGVIRKRGGRGLHSRGDSLSLSLSLRASLSLSLSLS